MSRRKKKIKTVAHLKNLLFPKISRFKKLNIAEAINEVLIKYNDNIEQSQAEIDKIIQNNLDSVEDRWGRMNDIMQGLSINYRCYKRQK